ncbi:MAG: FliM/FliN family flagellar motor switch protein [Gemmatimonadota bacterium]
MADERTEPGLEAVLKGTKGIQNDGLTQKDIDQLLQGSSGGRQRQSGVDIVPYNFLRPPRISKERRVTLESIYSRFALSVQSLLSSRLRTPADVTCSVEQATFSEYVLSIANPCAAFVFGVGGPTAAQGVLDVSTDIAFFMVDRLFGGPGEDANLQRALTALERTVTRSIVDRILNLLGEAWQEHLPIQPVVIGFESTPDMLQVANHEDNVLVATLEVRCGPFSGFMAMCVPLLALESFLGEKAGPNAAAARAIVASPLQRQHVEVSVRQASVELAARFPMFRLQARDVATLQVGQIIHTTTPVDAPVELHINGRRRYLGMIGQNRRTLGIRITQAVDLPTVGKARPSRGRIS